MYHCNRTEKEACFVVCSFNLNPRNVYHLIEGRFATLEDICFVGKFQRVAEQLSSMVLNNFQRFQRI